MGSFRCVMCDEWNNKRDFKDSAQRHQQKSQAVNNYVQRPCFVRYNYFCFVSLFGLFSLQRGGCVAAAAAILSPTSLVPSTSGFKETGDILTSLSWTERS